jgi:putative tryptophan/tyrosine transport system substrate-binding protein
VKWWDSVKARVLAAVALLILSAATVHGQRLVRIGVLSEGFGPTPWMVGLREALTELGYRERRDFVLGIRFTRGNPGELAAAAREMVDQNVDLLAVGAGPAGQAAHAATSRIPIVVVGGGDPVQLGLVRSYARPGGNLTGVVTHDLELAPKRLELLHGIVPGLKRVLFVHDPDDPYTRRELNGYREAARQLGVTLVERPARTRNDAEAAFAGLRRGEVHGILAPWTMSFNIPGLVLEAGTRLSLPTMFSEAFYVETGGLASYSPDLHGAGRQAARQVDKIIRGTPPGDIPIEVDNRIQFSLNLKVAYAIGVAVPPEMVLRASRLLQ